MAKPSYDIDILESELRRRGRLLDILLKDRTTGRNIIWATDSYNKTKKKSDPFSPKKQIKPELVTGIYGKLIQPRAAKSREEQRYRTKELGEVFTPLSAVGQMNRAIDWSAGTWPAAENLWKEYVKELKLEITCGEAPFIVSRYNPTSRTGKVRPIKNRVGFLDRKLHVVSQYCHTPKEWLNWAREAYKSSYGYEWQGDNILIARENLLYTLVDYYEHKFGEKPSLAIKEEFAKIISWNIFQMDGLKYVKPMSCKQTLQHPQEVPKNQLSFLSVEEPKKTYIECEGCRTNNPLEHTGVYVKVMDWDRGEKIRFVDLLGNN